MIHAAHGGVVRDIPFTLRVWVAVQDERGLHMVPKDINIDDPLMSVGQLLRASGASLVSHSLSIGAMIVMQDIPLSDCLRYLPPEGAVYAFMDAEQIFGKGKGKLNWIDEVEQRNEEAVPTTPVAVAPTTPPDASGCGSSSSFSR